MVIFRILASLLLAAGLMLLGADALTWLESGEAAFSGGRSGEHVLDLLMSQEGYTNGLLENSGAGGILQPIVEAPAWAPTGILGLLLAILFRRRD